MEARYTCVSVLLSVTSDKKLSFHDEIHEAVRHLQKMQSVKLGEIYFIWEQAVSIRPVHHGLIKYVLCDVLCL